MVPPQAVMFTIGDNAFGSSGMANSSDRTLYLISPSGDTVDSYTYSADNDKGISDEKIIESDNNTDVNWENARLINGTPGAKNSVTPLEFNLEIKTLTFEPSLPLEGDDVNLKITALNTGTETADNFTMGIYEDFNADSLPSSSELISSQIFTALGTGDSASVEINLGHLNPGIHYLIAKIDFPEDEDTSDNIMYANIRVIGKPYKYLDAAVNEIMYAPRGDEPEWFELFNNSGEKVNLKNWTASDNTTSVTLINRDMILPPDSFVVVSKDSVITDYYSIPSPLIIASFPYLNNGGDAVVIKDSLGVLIDSVYYSPDWGGTGGRSLERINPLLPSNDSSNWSSSRGETNGTPGTVNSVSQKDYDIKLIKMEISPANPILGQDVSISFSVKNTGRKTADFIIIAAADTNLDSLGDAELYNSPALHLNSGDSIIISNAFRIENVKKPLGISLSAVLDEDGNPGNNFLYTIVRPGYPAATVVINEIMYAPFGGEPEWIEIYNKSTYEVNLERMSVNDALASPTKVEINGNDVIPPDSYFLIARDSSVFNYHRSIPCGIIISELPVLNNDEDAVVLKDANGNVIDSVYYFSGWGGTGGYSLERKSADSSSNSGRNWGSSDDIEFSTPGRPNSIRIKKHDLSIRMINAVPKHPSRNETVFFQAVIKNEGSAEANNFIVRFYYEENGAKTLLNEENVAALNSGDSILVRTSSSFIMPNDSVTISANIYFPEDEDLRNDSLSVVIKPGYIKSSVLLNEMMIDPEPGKPEWIELVNNSDEDINFNSWSMSDILPSQSKTVLTDNDLPVSPGGYLVIADDSSFFNYYGDIKSKVIVKNFPALGNSNDGIVIYDFNGIAIDSLLYTNKWNIIRGRSLERISPDHASTDSTNWLPSIDISGGTPGKDNSVISVKDYSSHDMIINEIMSDPGVDNCEFIELLNISGKNVNLGGWKISEENNNYFNVSESSFEISPGDFFLIAADSLIFNKYSIPDNDNINILKKSDLGLANQGGMLVLKDLKGNTIDSIYYYENWHNKNYISTKNISLEKINPYMNSNLSSNWSSSAAPSGATPGRKNSIYSVNTDVQSKISVSPNPFSPDNDGFEDYTVINYSLPQTTAQVMIKIYDSMGRLVRTLANNSPSGSRGSVVFDGLDYSGRPLRIGIYIIYMEAINESQGALESMKTVVVVARKL